MKLKKHIRLIENFVSLTLFKSVDAVVPLVLIPYLIVVVGATNYGIYAFAYALIFYLRNIVQYGFSLSGVRLVALNKEDKGKLNDIYNNVITTQLFLALISLILLFFLVYFIDIFNSHYIIYFYFSFTIFGELMFPGWFFMGVERMKFSTISHVISRLLFAALVFIFVKEESDFIYISLYQSIGYVFSGIIAQIIVITEFKIKFKLARFAEVKKQLKDGLSSFLTLISPTLYANSSIFLVGVFGLPQYVGFMEIGSKVSGAFSVLDTILTMVFFPFINRNKTAMKKVKYIFISVGFVLSILMYFLSEFLITLWLKQPAPEIIVIVKILSFSPFLSSFISAYGVNGLMVHHQDKLYLKIVFFGSICGLIAGLILIPKYYYIGGAIAIVIARAITAFLAYRYNRKVINKTAVNEI
nr:oligosaccharide flippase family protein [uncultured Psychroserpens sp.]